MPISIPNFMPAIPEIFLLIMACVILLVSVFIPKKYSHNAVYFLSQLTLVIMIYLLFWLSKTYLTTEKAIFTFNGFFVLDRIGAILKIMIALTSFFVFIYSRQYVLQRKMAFNEYHVLALFSILGMMILVSANDFISLFLGLELTSLPLYALVAMKKDSSFSSEAGIKYFIIGTIATGMLLYGISMVYGTTGVLFFNNVSAITLTNSQNLMLILGLVFIMVGIAFKLGAVPFHMWLPDVYEGAPSTVTLFLASASKIAAFGMAVRLLFGLLGMKIQWQHLLILVSVLSIGIGNLVAIVQNNLKRLLAYSSIAHIGYMSLGLLTFTKQGMAAATFYMVSYAIMALGAFGLLVILSKSNHEMDNIDDFKGLNSRNPWLAFMMLLIMFSLAGIPPIVGFMAKVGVLEALIEVHLVWLAVYAIVFAIIGAYYYIRVVKVMYFEEPDVTTKITCPIDMRIAMTVNGLAVLALGVFPGALFTLCNQAF